MQPFFYGRSVSALVRNEMQIEQIQETYARDVDRAYEIADDLDRHQDKISN